jgi:DNA (cytosine-5)-methyltransferase 1
MTSCRPGLAAQYPALVDATRELLGECGVPWVMENVGGSGLAEQDDLFGGHGSMLCGAMFGLPLYRHRLFEASFRLHAPHHPKHLAPTSRAGHWAVAREAMGIGWMDREELAESIPPAYTEHVGRYLLDHLKRRDAA